MTKVTGVTLNLDVRSAAAVRQVLFDSQKGYTYNTTTVPHRIVDIRSVIVDIDEKIGAIVNKE